jgi:SAM-dependent methyltransferase
MGLIDYLDRRFYGGYPDCWDQLLFRNLVSRYLTPDLRVLDLGAGRGGSSYLDFRGHCSFIAGVDPDYSVLSNPYLEEAKVLLPPLYQVPYADGTFDAVLSCNVLEHVEDVNLFFGEVARVLKPGGFFLAKTPNKAHYVALAGRITPHWFHEWYNRKRGRHENDTFPTRYACNSRKEILQAATANGFHLVQFLMVEARPEYLRLNCVTYLLGLFYERLANHFNFLSRFRAVIMFCLVKEL